MFSQLTEFLCGPFFYPVFFASLLHAFDSFVYSAPQESTQSSRDRASSMRRPLDSVIRPERSQNWKNTNMKKEMK
jgi:hypothetical protein